ncbi:hypothetical protein EP7_003380 [Isosphaeraceae bacterium EP7]
MHSISRARISTLLVPILMGLLASLNPGDNARAQGVVAFQPEIDALPSGVSLPVTPVVSADRRYVRLGMNPQFTDFGGFQTFPVPAAVAGGNSSMGLGMNGGFSGMNGPESAPSPLYAQGLAGGDAFMPAGRSSTDLPFQAARPVVRSGAASRYSTAASPVDGRRQRRKAARTPLKSATSTARVGSR